MNTLLRMIVTRSRRIRMGLVATAAAIGLSAPAQAQFGEAAGFGEIMSPYFLRRDMVHFSESLSLDDGQRAILEILLEDYETDLEDGRARMLDGLASLRDEVQQLEKEQVLEVVFKPFEARADEWELQREMFLENVRAILNSTQLEQWPGFRRELRRLKDLPRGKFSGESVNLFTLLEEADLGPVADDAVGQILGAYDTTLDEVLRQREQQEKSSRLAMMNSIKDDNPEASLDLYRKQIRLSKTVRDTNQQYAYAMADAIEQNIGAEAGNDFRLLFQRTAYPRVYRKTAADRIFDAAMELSDVDEITMDAIVTLYEGFLSETGTVNARIVTLLHDYEPQDAMYRASSFARRSKGEKGQKPVDPTRDLYRERDAIGIRYIDNLKTLLTEEQFGSLPGASRYLRSEGDETAAQRKKMPRHPDSQIGNTRPPANQGGTKKSPTGN